MSLETSFYELKTSQNTFDCTHQIQREAAKLDLKKNKERKNTSYQVGRSVSSKTGSKTKLPEI